MSIQEKVELIMDTREFKLFRELQLHTTCNDPETMLDNLAVIRGESCWPARSCFTKVLCNKTEPTSVSL